MTYDASRAGNPIFLIAICANYLLCASSAAIAEAGSENIFSLDLRVIDDPKIFADIELDCPTKNTPLVHTTGNRHGHRDKYTLRFEGEAAVEVAEELSDAGKDYYVLYDFDVKNLASSDDLSDALDLMERGNTLLNEVCNGSPETKQRYRELLDSNLSILGLSPEDYPSNF